MRYPHDPEVPSSKPGKNNISDFSNRDQLSLPLYKIWYNIYLAMWSNSSVGRAADLIYSIHLSSQMSRVRFPVIPPYLGLYG